MAFSLARVRPAYLAALPPAREAPVAHYWSLLRYALRRVGDEPTARDVVAETFTVAWRRWEQVPPDPLPWLYGVARRVIAAERRRQQRADSLSCQLSMRPAPTGDAKQLRETLDALVTLRPTDQEVLPLHVWEGLTGPSLATALGCSLPAAHVYVFIERASACVTQ